MKIEERFFKVPFCVSKIKVALNVVIEPSCVLTQLLLLNIEKIRKIFDFSLKGEKLLYNVLSNNKPENLVHKSTHLT